LNREFLACSSYDWLDQLDWEAMITPSAEMMLSLLAAMALGACTYDVRVVLSPSDGGGETVLPFKAYSPTGNNGGYVETACTLSEVTTIFSRTPTSLGCTVSSACHDSKGFAAGLDLTTVGFEKTLVGRMPSAGAGSIPSMCANMGLVYLEAGSDPATGLLIDKIDPSKSVPPCGMHMPELGPSLTETQFDCVQSWATTLTTGLAAP
jgi:hypothetical protein